MGAVSKNITRKEYIVSFLIKKGVKWPQRMESTRAHISWMRSSGSAGISLGPVMCLLKAFSGFVKSEDFICLDSLIAAN